MSAAIGLTGVRKSFGAGFALGPLDLQIPQGAIYALVGPNGAGKSTTLSLLMGAGRPDRGEIEILGLPLPQHEVQIKRRVGYVSPELDYSAWKSVGNAINFVRGFYPDWDETYCEWLQTKLGVHRGEQIAELSFGGRIKLSLILALSRQCDLLVLDEPTVGLDAVSRRQIFTELLHFMEREDHTILISSHQLSDIERFADHLAVMNEGRLLTSGRMDRLVERYRLLDVRCVSGARVALGRLQQLPSAAILQRDGERVQLLLDAGVTSPDALAGLGFDVLESAPLGLEELFLALINGDNSARPWHPA